MSFIAWHSHAYIYIISRTLSSYWPGAVPKLRNASREGRAFKKMLRYFCDGGFGAMLRNTLKVTCVTKKFVIACKFLSFADRPDNLL